MADLKKTLKQAIKKGLYWGLPRGIVALGMNRLKKYREDRKIAEMKFLQNNLKFKDCHKGERCFILACGPSIKQQDLTLLKGETCITVSNFYVHKDYDKIRPAYHCVPDVLGGHKGYITEEYAVKWFREMEERTGQSVMFLSAGDKEWIERHGLFRNREVSYLYFGGSWEEIERTGIDLTRSVPGVQSVSIMALTIAIYMGFKDIYLLGCDHDWILHYGTSVHFYEENESILATRAGYGEWANTDLEEQLKCCWVLWSQYKAIRRYIEAKGGKVYYANRGGLLDVFPRIDYESLFVRSGKHRPIMNWQMRELRWYEVDMTKRQERFLQDKDVKNR